METGKSVIKNHNREKNTRESSFLFLTAYTISKSDTATPSIAIGLVKTITKRLRSANLQIKSLSLNDAEGKIATVLLQLSLDIGNFNEKGVTISNLPIQQTIASMASTSRETVSRILNNFCKKEIIELEGSELKILDFEKFRINFT